MRDMPDHERDESEGNRERPSLTGQMIFKGDFNEDEGT